MTRWTIVVLVLLLALSLAPTPSSNAQKYDLDKPTGEWKSQGGTNTITFKSGNRLVWQIGQPSGQGFALIEADYATTKDSRIYGIVTKIVSNAGTAQSLPEEDDTFSFRFRIDEDELSVKDVKGKGFEQLKSAAGRYKKVDEKPATTKGELKTTKTKEEPKTTK